MSELPLSYDAWRLASPVYEDEPEDPEFANICTVCHFREIDPEVNRFICPVCCEEQGREALEWFRKNRQKNT